MKLIWCAISVLKRQLQKWTMEQHSLLQTKPIDKSILEKILGEMALFADINTKPQHIRPFMVY